MSAVEALDSRDTVSIRPTRGPAAVPGSEDFAWRVLGLLNLFRLGLSALLLAAFFLIRDPTIVGDVNPRLALGAMLAMMSSSVANVWLIRLRQPSAAAQIFLQVALDIATITLLMHASGGVSSGIGGLLIVSIGVLALLVNGEQAFLMAALATLTILGAQTTLLLQGSAGTAQYAPAGILGAVIFVITALVQALRHRMRETEALAEQRGVDLRNLAELNQYIVRHLRESIVVVDGDDRVRLMNDSAAIHLGAASRRAGQPLREVSPELANRLEVWRVQGRPPGKPPAQFSSADGASTIRPHFAGLGGERTGGTLIFLEDMSMLAERTQNIKLASLGRLSASIAHEIRNPIGAMSHAGQLLAESPTIGSDEKRLTDIIRVNSTRVSQIVESILALSRRQTTRPERIELAPWLMQFCREFVQTLELFEAAVGCTQCPDDLVARMDPTHLHQVVWNLCDNAVKYASATAGAIAVEISGGRLEHSGRVFLEIADRGPGIDPDKAEEVFEPFYTGKDGGTGLGLFISRELCDSNGASLSYQPRAGGGSVFRIVFADLNRWQ
ncbi:MAG TPA: HAMP domain-containing sensor histidine kinase [Gammaproteobacteria bacterium]|jgi:two-component system sensor histidine kinase PilS (NtrC family)